MFVVAIERESCGGHDIFEPMMSAREMPNLARKRPLVAVDEREQRRNTFEQTTVGEDETNTGQDAGRNAKWYVLRLLCVIGGCLFEM